MKLENLNENSLIYLENFVNQRSYSRFCNDSEVSKKYRPKFAYHGFKLPVLEFDRTEVEIIISNPSKKVLDIYLGGKVKFPIHPDIFYGDIKKKFSKNLKGHTWAKPTASTRTVLIEDNHEHFIKLHLPKRISRYNRRLSDSSVMHSILISKELEKINYPDYFGFLPETIGIYHKKEKFGFIVREKMIRSKKNLGGFLIPFFSLTSSDELNSKDEPILFQLIKKSRELPEMFFIDKILKPFIESWTDVVQKTGILLEMHGQNTLLEIDNDFLPKKIIYRDFQSLVVDPKIREDNNFEIPFSKHIIGRDGFCREKEFALTYDYLIFHHLISPIVEAFSKEYNKKTNVIYLELKKILMNSFPKYREFFPKKGSYQFANQTFGDNKTVLKKVDFCMEWR